MCLVLFYHKISSDDLLGNESDIILNCQKICPQALQINSTQTPQPTQPATQSLLSTYGQDYPTDDLIALINFDPEFEKLPQPPPPEVQIANKLSLKLFVLDCVYHQICREKDKLNQQKLEEIGEKLEQLRKESKHLIVQAKAAGIQAVIKDIISPSTTSTAPAPPNPQQAQGQASEFIGCQLPSFKVEPFTPIFTDTSSVLRDISTRYSSLRNEQTQATPRQDAPGA